MATYTLSDSSSGVGHWGDIALVFSGANGTGATASTTGTGAPQVGITTTQDHSSIAVLALDWNGVSGASRTWLTVNGITPTAGNGDEVNYTLDGTNYASYVAVYPDAGLKGTVTVGLSAPTGTKFTIIAVEITGTGITSTGSFALAPLALSGSGSSTQTGKLVLGPLALSGTATVSAPSPFPQIPLGIKIEILINGTWTDITGFVYGRSDVTISRGRPDETQQIQPAQCTVTLDNRDGRFSPSSPQGAYSPYFGRNVQLRVSISSSFAWSTQTFADTYTSSYTDLYGVPTTVPQSGSYSGYRFWGEISSVTQHTDESGKDIYVEVVASGPLRRRSQGNVNLGSALRRYYSRLSGNLTPYAYWPCEDSTGVTMFASWVSGVPGMGFTGSPQFASDTSFGGSDSIPQVNLSAWHGQTAAASTPSGSGSLAENVPGTYTWTAPPGVTQVTGVLCTGGGGGGGGFGSTRGGGGGGGGGTGKAASAAVTPGTTYPYTVGTGGAAASGPSAQGVAGTSSTVTWDSVTVTGLPGQGGLPGNTSTGGAGGPASAGGNAGGVGGTGQASTTTTQALVLRAPAGSNGGTAGGGTAGQVTFDWTVPAGVTQVTITGTGGGGGGAGGGRGGAGAGGAAGGGGGYATGIINVTAGNSYTMKAGYGGAGGVSAASGQYGNASTVSGDSGSVVYGGGGAPGAAGGGVGGAAAPSGHSGGKGGAPGAKSGSNMGGGGGGGGGAVSTSNGGGGASGSGRAPGGGTGNGGGGGWGASSSGGTNATGGHTGGTSTSGAGGGGGGGGAITNSSGKVGAGGGGGYIVWQWAQPNVPSGGGGGGSAGSSANGNAGSNGGTGGAAVTGGGAGGGQGNTGQVPGGGGGGGVPNTGNMSSGTIAPGAGAAGQVAFSWNGGSISPVPADIVRFLLNVQPTGGVRPSYSFTATSASPCVFTITGASYANGTPVRLSGSSIPTGFNNSTTYYVVSSSGSNTSGTSSTPMTFELAAKVGGTPINSSSTGSGNVARNDPWVVARALTYGTVARMDVTYQVGGSLALTGYDSTGVQLFTSPPVTFGIDGVPVLVDMQLVAAGTGATWHINVVQPGASVQYGLSGTVNSVTVGYVSDVLVSPGADVDFASVGQVSVQSYADTIGSMSQVIAGYAGETASARLARICGEEGISFALTAGGQDSDTPQMGSQQDDTLINVLQSCEDMDRGHLYEDRGSFGLSYRTRASLQGQDPALTLDWSAGDLAADITPVSDDQWTRNDIQISISNTSTGQGSAAYIAQQTAGPMSINDPPNGVGHYAYSTTVRPYSVAQLANLAAWILSVGTASDARYPVLPLDLTRPEVANVATIIAGLDIGDFVQVISAPAWITSQPISELAWGFAETLNTFAWTISINAVPESPYGAGNPPTW